MQPFAGYARAFSHESKRANSPIAELSVHQCIRMERQTCLCPRALAAQLRRGERRHVLARDAHEGGVGRADDGCGRRCQRRAQPGAP
eukprot:2547806-Pleurochrysis_carterae.AAC.1